MIKERYIKNIDSIFTEQLQESLLIKTIAVIGCGAQGGFIAEFLARLGVGKILLWDGDVYVRSNLNRQIGCFENNIGAKKSSIIKDRIEAINSDISVIEHSWYFGEQENDNQELLSADFIFLSFDDSQNVVYTRELIRQVILQGVPALDCPNNLTGGFISIVTKRDLGHYDWFTETLKRQKENPNLVGLSTGYKCALIAAEAVNCMVQYFNQDRFAPIDSTLDIDIYHHQYFQSDRYGKF